MPGRDRRQFFRKSIIFSFTHDLIPADGGKVTVRLEGESLWVTQEQMAELFGREHSVITKHLRNVFLEELEESSVCANFARAVGDEKTYQTQPTTLTPSFRPVITPTPSAARNFADGQQVSYVAILCRAGHCSAPASSTTLPNWKRH